MSPAGIVGRLERAWFTAEWVEVGKRGGGQSVCGKACQTLVEFQDGGWRRRSNDDNSQILVWVRKGMMTVQQ